MDLRSRTLPWVSFIIIFAPAFAFFSFIYRLPFSAYVQDINVDDSFYYYQVARNFARGLFSTADGLNVTNGYHPLWAWLLVPVFTLVKDPIVAIRVAKMEELSFLLLASWLTITAAQTAKWRMPILCAIPIWFFTHAVFFLGLEASVQVLLLSALMLLLVRSFQDSADFSVFAALAAICALLPWARLECIAVSIATATIVSLCIVRRKQAWHAGILLVWSATIGSVALYLIYNKLAFGTAVPVSGQIKLFWSEMHFAQDHGYDLFRDTKAFLRNEWRPSIATAICVAIVAVSWLVAAYRTREYDANHGIDGFILILASAHLARMAFSIVTLDPLYDVGWYYIPGDFLLAMTAPFAISRSFILSRLLTTELQKTWIESWLGAAVLAAGVLFFNPYHTMAPWRAGWRSVWGAASFHGVEWMNANLPPDAVIGSADSGIVSYFSKHTVVNLDGLMNSSEFLSAVKSQSVEPWIKQQQIGYFANAMWDNVDPCRFMARASGQAALYAGRCTTIYEGNIAWQDDWNNERNKMRFRVVGFQWGDHHAGVELSVSRPVEAPH